MKLTFRTPARLARDLWSSLLLLVISFAGGLLAQRSMIHTGMDSMALRILLLLVQPLALAAWLFCGLPGMGLAARGLHLAMNQGRVPAGMFSAGLLVFAGISATVILL